MIDFGLHGYFEREVSNANFQKPSQSIEEEPNTERDRSDFTLF